MPIKFAASILMLFSSGVFSACVMAQATETAKYVSLPSGSTIELDVKKSRIVFDAHTIVGANACVGKPEYNCLVGGDALFIFPKRMQARQTTWEYQGKNFKVQKNVEGEILGRKYSGFLITRPSEKDGYWYIYSPRDGLVAFGLSGQSANSTFFIEGRCGFGADGCGNS